MSLRKSELADNEIQLVEQHLIKVSDPRYGEIDAAAFAAKNLWNAANYVLRQAFIHENRVVSWKELYAEIKTTEAYQALPRKVSNQVLIQLKTAWSCFFKGLAAWKKEPDKFLGRPKLPKYKPKTEGRNLLTYESGAVHKRSLLMSVRFIWPFLPNIKRSLKSGSCPATGTMLLKWSIFTRSNPTRRWTKPWSRA
jgi:putative transposase